MRLLIFVDWFLPGYKAGGQISSCSNIVYAVADKMDIFIITSDRDLDDTASYPGIETDKWVSFEGKATINYASPGRVSYRYFKELIKEIAPDTIYFNSMFSYPFTLLPLVVIKGMGYRKKVILAPRGMLQAGALRFKTAKKKAVLLVCYYGGIFKNLLFHATDGIEMKDIEKNIKGNPRIQLVVDFPAVKQELFCPVVKEPGRLQCLFVSRVVGKKNLLYLLQVLAGVKTNIGLTIAGPVEDKDYWNECLRQIAQLPANCRVNYIGPVPNHQLAAIYRQHHLFVLPTLGENFGHVIFDAFLNGRPVLISTNTPWRGLEPRKAGFDIDLAAPQEFTQALEFFAGMQSPEINEWAKNAWTLAAEHVNKVSNLKEQYQTLFN